MLVADKLSSSNELAVNISGVCSIIKIVIEPELEEELPDEELEEDPEDELEEELLEEELEEDPEDELLDEDPVEQDFTQIM